ncbi:hypothetical protein L6654_42470 [Bradyrhizobium sp. WYCCWR 13023]|uniref:Uncharacterized protein n=1 Tax=Bradyrhizobium zhengyangense TaxID=2911009 RepID=A0A9X1RKN3_9BRAD|nr:hypothetical protein [Bradyrhizobium sp. CCBAU 11434]MCG2633183.1 hypothetical protein [Bradyrhizobium zhengyangense]MCG2673420.1 hypothetical protein [Bradyrhizobium zhengyangense]MDA9522826.1 hypothetical protein [Bradyrhizobium sp. CCBAU 11434]
MRNDTAVFDAIRLDADHGEKNWVGQMGTREAIARDRLEIDPASLAYCPHEWINHEGYVDIELVRKYPLLVAL